MADERSFRAPIDLHTHSSVSDGTQTPRELVQSAAAAGLGTVALTDHDSTSGWQDAGEEGLLIGVSVIPGMELSTRIDYKSIHVLGYLFDPENSDLMSETRRIREGRLTRARDMVEKISHDYPITWNDVLAQATQGATVGRPHIADALVARGLVADRSAAFASILNWRSGYVHSHYAPHPLDGVRLIRAAGGVPVLAHPAASPRGVVIPENELRALVDAGLFGLELDHRENQPEGVKTLRSFAQRYGLAITGSSDYHGSGKPNVLGENTTAPEVVDRIISESSGSVPFFAN